MSSGRAPADAAVPVFDSGLCAPSKRKFILIAAVLASAMGFIDSTVVAIAVPSLRLTLDASLPQIQWISNAYMLPLAALLLAGGAAGDRFGLARVFRGGIALFVVASLVCAIAPTASVLIAARTIQGLGAAFMVPGSLAIIARAYPREERGRAIGIWAAASSTTTALGPMLGGVMLSLGGPEAWRAIFAINLPLGAVALWLLWPFVDNDRQQPERGVDLIGAGLATVGLGLIAWGLTLIQAGGPAGAWIGAGLAVLVVFFIVELPLPQPMLPPWLFRLPGFAAANVATLVLFVAFTGILFFLPMTVVAGWGVSVAVVPFALLPLTVFMATMSTWSGRMADRIGPGPMIAAGGLMLSLAYAGLGLLTPHQNFWGHVVPAICVMGFGMGLLVSPLSTAVMTAAPDEMSGVASGINNAVARMAGLISVAGLGGVAALGYAAAGGTDSFGIPSAAPEHAAAMSAGFANVAWTASALAFAAALIAGLGIRRQSSD